MSALDGINGTVCNSEPDTIKCLTHGQTIGLSLAAVASFLSLAAITVILGLIGRNVLRYRRALPNGGWKLLQIPADIYMLSLFMYDILQALGGALNVRWAHNRVVTVGSYCTAQGVIQQIGELGVALIALAITVHTFVSVLWDVGVRARRFTFGIVALISLFTALWVGIGNGVHKDYETPTPYWCWISSKYKLERLGGEYVWMWTALFASVIMYIPLYFWTKGRLSIDPEKWYKFRLHESNNDYPQRRAALGILLYPLAYSITILPLSVVRWSLYSHPKVPSAAVFFAVSVYNLSGAIDVILFLIVRPRLLLFPPPEVFCGPRIELERLNIKSVKFPDNHSPQPTEKGLVVDMVKSPTVEGSGNSVALSRGL